MQQYKVDNYAKEHKGHTFPTYTSLSPTDCTSIIKNITDLLPSPTQGDNLFVAITNTCAYKSFTDDELDDLAHIFTTVGFSNDEDIYLMWNEQEIDQMKTSLLVNHWYDIWHPSSDEAVILYQATSKKFLLIHHAATVYYN